MRDFLTRRTQRTRRRCIFRASPSRTLRPSRYSNLFSRIPTKLIALNCIIYLSCSNLTAVEAEQYKVGAILPLSGDVASMGNNVKDGIELALKSLQQDELAPVKVIYEDDQLTPTKSVAAFNKLVFEDRVKAVIVFGSGIGNTIAPLAEQQKVVMIAVGASDHKVSAGRTFSFTHWVNPEMEGEMIAREVKRRGYKRIAMLIHEHDGLNAIASAIRKAMDAEGIGEAIIFEKSFVPESKDFKSIIPLLKGQQVDAVAPLLFPASLGTFARQSRELGFEADIFGADVFEDADAKSSAKGALNGSWYSIGSNGTETYENAFKSTFGKNPGAVGANGHDALVLLALGAANHGHHNIEIAKFLRTLSNFEGACGTYGATGDNRFALPAVLKSVTATGYELIKGR